MIKICFFINVLVLFFINASAQSIKDSADKKTALFKFTPPAFNSTTFINPLPADYYYTHLGFFCKQEIQIQKATKLPLKIRVGTITDCNKLEGKSF